MTHVLCVGGIADGEMREVPVLLHGATFTTHEKINVVAKDEAAEPQEVTHQLYRLHEFRMSNTLFLPNPKAAVVSKWVAAPADWSTEELFDNLVAGYAQIHEDNWV